MYNCAHSILSFGHLGRLPRGHFIRFLNGPVAGMVLRQNLRRWDEAGVKWVVAGVSSDRGILMRVPLVYVALSRYAMPEEYRPTAPGTGPDSPEGVARLSPYDVSAERGVR